MAKKERGLVISDSHCGHLVGLSMPEYHKPIGEGERQEKYAAVRKSIWEYFVEEIVEPFRPFDFLIFNGDATDGKGDRSGGTEHLTTDRVTQSRMAADIINYINAEKVFMVYGTHYHVNGPGGEDWEDLVADMVGAKIGSHEWINVNGRIFDFKHKISSSTIPHGRLTALAREILWNRIWAARGLQPLADVLIRSHVHYYEMEEHQDCLGFITPALQGYGSKFGARECSGLVDIGGLIFDVYPDGEIQWYKRKAEIESQKAKAILLRETPEPLSSVTKETLKKDDPIARIADILT